ncbi:Myo-inosose-2 dehydratase [Lentibacillus sp. JNUCC-1]|uniref:sugar phosphate isomerase/epimerase family protein n=1 Tax=Lentibacillus sp. JNUCC-1 TaxID=2654513 RepID=UPI0012E72C9F|nr:TIM barrel protein [Lentibacillus sp. JNUCC-1]MUV37063.1 Myo-inosose-2 dehydratase [Lentibacillus sp. JNUCC-1]
MNIKFGCHGSTWELDYDKKTDYLPHIMDVVENAGFQGIDVQISLLGRFAESPESLKEELDKRGLQLAALTVPFSWLHNEETKEERELANYYMEYIKHFPGALLNVAPRTFKDRNNLINKQRNIISCANSLAKRAFEQGVLCSFHPSSPDGSAFRTEEDYKILFEGLDMKFIGYTPDAGHISMGGMDVLEIFKQYLPYIKHVHFKDASITGEWRKMGTGDIDFPEIVKMLRGSGYHGWIMVEEETEQSSSNPDEAIKDISDYVSMNLK